MDNIKTYSQLPIPKDSAWDRKTWRSYSPIWFLNFTRGIKSLIEWLPVIWKDRHWDHTYIFEILKYKIELQREYLVKSNRHTRIEADNRDMTNVLNLIERVQQEYYAIEYMDYVDSKFEDAYLKKYPNSVRVVMKKDMRTATDKDLLCLHVAQYNQEKAHKLLFKILNERINYWWD